MSQAPLLKGEFPEAPPGWARDGSAFALRPARRRSTRTLNLLAYQKEMEGWEKVERMQMFIFRAMESWG